MKATYDVVIVGGGIAGSSLAARLAREGVDVLVLEKSLEYADRVRGEAMLPWGVAETKRLGLYDALIQAGGRHTDTWLVYDEGLPEPTAMPVGYLLPDNAPLNLGHPVACSALAAAAQTAGATYVRGVSGVTLGPDRRTVAFGNGNPHEVTARLVVGADGRRSTVREQAGIQLHHQEPTHMLTGLLVEPAGALPDEDLVAAEGNLFFLSFMQSGNRTRVYAAPSVEQRARFTGRQGAAELLAALRIGCLPFADALADGTAAGPCATYPGDDTWTDEPFADGVVLVGDAAGYNNPLLGQGLSLAMRDVRIVSDLLLADEEWRTELFRPYGEERVERMRRVRVNANVMAAIFCDYGPGAKERRVAANMRRASDPVLLQGLMSAFTGPESAPAEAFADDVFDRIFAPA